MTRFAFCLIFVFCYLIITHAREMKRQPTFRSLGCMGKLDKHKFNRVNEICEGCYKIYRDPRLLGRCKSNCFNNDDFVKCVIALKQYEQLGDLQTFVNELYGNDDDLFPY